MSGPMSREALGAEPSTSVSVAPCDDGTGPVVVLQGIGKRYGPVRALDGVDLRLVPGRVHAIVGENGAGKSTLLQIATGHEEPDQGEVAIEDRTLGRLVPLRSGTQSRMRVARRLGIAMVQQHFALVPDLTGIENLILGNEPTRFGLLDFRARRRTIEARARALGLEVPLDVPVEELSVGERQRLELLRALVPDRRGHAGVALGSSEVETRALILDEPTAVLSSRDAEQVLGLAVAIARQGVAVALVTHRLDEVARHADEVTVLRRGRRVAHHPPGDPAVRDAAAIAHEALGEDPPRVERRARVISRATPAAHVLRARGLHARASGAPLRAFDLDLAAGEIVGIAGVEGNGQLALEHALAGLARIEAGHLEICGADHTRSDVAQRRAAGLAWIPSDRHAHGIAGELSAADTLRLGALREVARGPFVDDAALRALFDRAARAFDLRPSDPDLAAVRFSGGNQQKLVVARELRGRPHLVLAAHPTRGVDVRVAAMIREALVAAAEGGAAVVVISADLDELRAIADRLVVLRSGAIARILPPDASSTAIGEAMLG
jgi:simple sugar transport system ATP-binding protein